MNVVIEVGRTPLNTPVRMGLSGGLIALVQGQSGSGKSILGNGIVLELAKVMRSSVQFAIMDPKRVSFQAFGPRCHVYPHETDWLRLLEALCSEMERRYDYMLANALTEYPITQETPFILLVADEMSAISNNQRLLKKERDQISSLLVNYSNMCRQCSMGLLLLCQSADSTVMPTVVRSNCSTRFAMRTSGAEQVKMIAAGRDEECPADLLSMPGQFFALTSETNGRWVKGRARYIGWHDQCEAISQLAPDKRMPYCLDWDSPDYLG